MNSDFVVAVHALTALHHHKNETLSSERLADNVCTNPVRIRRVMAKLKKAGLVETRLGCADGGYACHMGAVITLRQVAEALNAQFTETTWRSGDAHMECHIASGMAGYVNDLYEQLNELCLKRLARITIADVEQTLCKQTKEENQ